MREELVEALRRVLDQNTLERLAAEIRFSQMTGLTVSDDWRHRWSPNHIHPDALRWRPEYVDPAAARWKPGR